MTLKDLLKKKDKIKDEGAAPTARGSATLSPDVPEFQFYRTTTSTHEAIEPPSHPDDPTRAGPLLSPEPRGAFGRFRRHSNASSQGSHTAEGATKGLERLHFGRARSATSANVPENLPEVGGDGVARTEEEEAKWEKRATVLVTEGLGQAGTTFRVRSGCNVSNRRLPTSLLKEMTVVAVCIQVITHKVLPLTFINFTDFAPVTSQVVRAGPRRRGSR